MKNFIYMCIAMFCVALTTACSNETEKAVIENQENATEFTFAASTGADTRTYVEPNKENLITGEDYTYYYPVYWSEGDELKLISKYVGNSRFSGVATLIDGKDTSKGTFKAVLGGTVSSMEDVRYAIYPRSYFLTEAGNRIQMHLPSEYEYGKTYAPMYAIFGDDKTEVTFHHLCAMHRYRLKNVPSDGVKKFTFTRQIEKPTGEIINEYMTGGAQVFIGAEDNLTTLTLELSEYDDERNTVVVTIPDGTPASNDEELVIDIPVPPTENHSCITAELTTSVETENETTLTVENNFYIHFGLGAGVMYEHEFSIVDTEFTGDLDQERRV